MSENAPNFQYRALVTRVVDGDTLDVSIDLGFRTWVKERVRLYGIDTPETYGVKKGSEEWTAGMAAKDAVLAWLDDSAPIGVGDPMGRWEVYLRSHDGKRLGQGKYGRWLVEVWPITDNEGAASLNAHLVATGHAEQKEY